MSRSHSDHSGFPWQKPPQSTPTLRDAHWLASKPLESKFLDPPRLAVSSPCGLDRLDHLCQKPPWWHTTRQPSKLLHPFSQNHRWVCMSSDSSSCAPDFSQILVDETMFSNPHHEIHHQSAEKEVLLSKMGIPSSTMFSIFSVFFHHILWRFGDSSCFPPKVLKSPGLIGLQLHSQRVARIVFDVFNVLPLPTATIPEDAIGLRRGTTRIDPKNGKHIGSQAK